MDEAHRLRNCPDCGGRGEVRADCSACYGEGKLRCAACEGHGEIYVGGHGQEYVRCGFCHGLEQVRCDRCAGSGKELKHCSTCDSCGQVTYDEFDRIAARRASEADRQEKNLPDLEKIDQDFEEFIASLDRKDKEAAREHWRNLLSELFVVGVLALLACAVIGFVVYRLMAPTPARNKVPPVHAPADPGN